MACNAPQRFTRALTVILHPASRPPARSRRSFSTQFPQKAAPVQGVATCDNEKCFPLSKSLTAYTAYLTASPMARKHPAQGSVI